MGGEGGRGMSAGARPAVETLIFDLDGCAAGPRRRRPAPRSPPARPPLPAPPPCPPPPGVRPPTSPAGSRARPPRPLPPARNLTAGTGGGRTLYLNSSPYVKHTRARAREYLMRKFGWTAEEADAQRRAALAARNQTALGLRALGHDLDTDEFVLYMREGEDQYLKPDAALRATLEALPQRKILMTNTREGPARRALACLGVSDLFAGVYGADFMGDTCKPEEGAFARVLEASGARAATSAMFEDSLRNVIAAKKLGMTTVFIRCEDEEVGLAEAGGEDDVQKYADYKIHSVAELRQVAPELFA